MLAFFPPVINIAVNVFRIVISCNFVDAPVCRSQSREVFGVARQELVSVTCEVNANPADNMKFDWIFSKGDEKLDMQQSQIR